MILELPFSADASQEVIVQLGTGKYIFELRYNDRAGVWAMTMSDFATGVVLLDSIAMVMGVDLLAPYDMAAVGRIVVTDEDGTGLDAGPEDMGGRVKAYWLSSDE